MSLQVDDVLSFEYRGIVFIKNQKNHLTGWLLYKTPELLGSWRGKVLLARWRPGADTLSEPQKKTWEKKGGKRKGHKLKV